LTWDSREASDTGLCKYATANDRIIVSKDEDFLYLVSRPNATFQLVWVRLGNCRTTDLIEAFERVWSKVESSLKAGEQIIEIR
jgi:predicted nuclease of predicted toxin-antitoxin system